MPDWKRYVRERLHLVHAGSARGPFEAGSPARNPGNGKRRFPALLPDLRSDLLYGFRLLKKSPGFTAIALITLALGIGVNTAVFSLFEAWQRLPNRLEEPDTLAFLWRSGTFRLSNPRTASGSIPTAC